MAEKLVNIESRIAALERIVFGLTPDQGYQTTEALVDKLSTINNKLATILSGSEKTKELMNQVISMRQYFDPAFSENLTAPLDAKFHVVELSAPVQENRAKYLEQLKALEFVLDSEHIMNASKESGKLARLCLRHGEQADAVHSHTLEISELVNTYSKLVMALSKQAVYWDQSVTALESGKAKVTPD